jgi:hypothetical protein
MVVRIDEHRRDVAENGGRVRRLEHLPHVVRVEERVVVREPVGEAAEGGAQSLVVDRHAGVPIEGSIGRLPCLDGGDGAWQPDGEVRHVRLPRHRALRHGVVFAS